MKKKKISDMNSLLPGGHLLQQYRRYVSVPAGWVRIGVTNSLPSMGIIFITNMYNAAHPGYATISLNFPYSGISGNVAMLHKRLGPFTKIRIVRVGISEHYIEVYMNSSNQLYVTLSGAINLSLLSELQVGSIPEGATSVEYDL